MTMFADKARSLTEAGLFDEDWYVSSYPDVLRSGMLPIDHFIRIGQSLGRQGNGDRSAPRPGPSDVARDVPAAVAPQTQPPKSVRPPRHLEPAPRPALPAASRLPTAATYTQYEALIFEKIDALAMHAPLPVDVEIDVDYTGLASGTQFDFVVSEQEREDNARQITLMLQRGITAINPRPGVHAARDDTGELIRYSSIPARAKSVQTVPSSMLVHIHAFYPDVVDEMLDYFVGEAKTARFLVTTTTRKNADAVRKILDDRDFTRHDTILIDNKGRDIGPFLDYAVDRAAEGEVICHIHTKKTPDVGESYGEKWRKNLYGTLLTQTAIDAFADPRLGLLFPDTSRSVGWGKNHRYCEQIALHFGRQLPRHPGPIPVGNMFFARTEVARAMRDATGHVPWPKEPVPYDGSILHAIERLWPMACEHAGFEWAAIHANEDSSNLEFGEDSATIVTR